MAKTVLNQVTIGENGCTFYSYPCRFEDTCIRYDPALTLKDSHGTTKLNPCTHGGGLSCGKYKAKLRWRT